jgi:outer membrane protein assembly factor BamB
LLTIKTYFSTALLVFGLLTLNGCSSVTGLKDTISDKVFGREDPNAPTALEEIKPTVQANIVWQIKVGKAENFEFSPKVQAGHVFAASTEGFLEAVDEATGKSKWKLNVGEPLSGGVGAGGGLVFVGTLRGAIYAYSIEGVFKWKAQLSSEVLSPPEYFDGFVIVRTGDSKIYGIDAIDGMRKWVYDRTGPALVLRSSAGLVVDGGAVYAGFAGGKLIAVRADNGKLLWEAAVALPKGVTEIERIADITSLPVVDGPVVYAVAYQGRIAAVDRRTGKVLWNRDISSLNGLSIEDERIYLTHASDSVYSLDLEKGKSFWRQGTMTNRHLSTPLPMGQWIALGDVEGYVHFLNRDTGAIEGRIKVASSPLMPKMSLIDDATLVVQSRDGEVIAVKLNK